MMNLTTCESDLHIDTNGEKNLHESVTVLYWVFPIYFILSRFR